VRIWKFAARPKFSGSRHYAKPLGRYMQAVRNTGGERNKKTIQTEKLETNQLKTFC
jgi:hypothetical protein